MRFMQWWNHRKRSNAAKRAQASKSARTLNIEGLEERQLPTSANAYFLGALYQNLLARTAQSSEIAHWENQMNNGMTREQVAAGFVGSWEYRENAVNDLYRNILRRAPDTMGFHHWMKYLETNSLTQAKAEFLGSQEYFIVQSGGSLNSFIDRVYLDALGRFPDAPGQADFLAKLQQGMSRVTVASFIVNSVEANAELIDTTYLLYLNRSSVGDPGAWTWVLELSAGTSFQQVQILITASAEYFVNVQPIG